MERFIPLIFVCLTLFFSAKCDSIICGDDLCTGGSPYCCTQDDGTEGCCWDTYVYQLWWFWFVWVVIFLLVLSCSLACWRRRRLQYRYVMMSRSEYPTYGTVVHSAPQMVYPGHTVAPAPPAAATAPVKPPSYEAAQASKPPPYSA